MKRLTAIVLLSAAAAGSALAQKTEQPAKPTAPNAPRPTSPMQNFAFTFTGGAHLGLALREVSNENYQKLGLSEVRGVLIDKVIENSAAAKAGLMAGDVVVKFDGENVTGVRKMTRLISEVAPDHKVTLTVVRGGAEMDVVVTVEKREFQSFSGTTAAFTMPAMPVMPTMPEMKTMPNIAEMPRMKMTLPSQSGGVVMLDGNSPFFVGSARHLGLMATSLSKQLATYFGVDEKGLLVSEVRENGAAAKAGLRAGDVIVEIDGKPVESTMSLVRGVAEKKDGPVTLTIVRERQRQTVTVTPEK